MATEDGETDVQTLRQINLALVQESEAKDRQIAELRSHLDDLLNDGIDSEKDRRISDLMKKNRNLTMRLNKERGANAQLQEQVENMKKELVSAKAAAESSANDTKMDENSVESALQELKAKYDRSMTRISSLRDEVQRGQRELAKMRQLLRREIGDETAIDKYLENPEGYRGRAQQIFILKAKIRKMREKLANRSSSAGEEEEGEEDEDRDADDEEDDNLERLSTAEERNRGRSPSAPKTRNVDERARARLSQIERERRQDMIELQRKLEAKSVQSRKLKMQAASIQARNKILEESLADMKGKIARLLEKAEIDSKLVNALRKELDDTQRQLREQARAAHQHLRQQHSTRGAVQRRRSSPESANSTASSTISSYIRPKLPLSGRSGAGAGAGGNDSGSGGSSLFQMHQMRQMEERIRSLEQMNDTQAQELLIRMDQIRDLRNEIQRISQNRLGTLHGAGESAQHALKELQLKLTISNVEVEKLRELRQVLENRVRELEDGSSRRVGGLSTLGNIPAATGGSPSGSMKRSSSSKKEFESIDKLKEQLTLAQDEVHALRETLRATTESKNDEAKIYNDMIERQREMFSEYIEVLKGQLREAGIEAVDGPLAFGDTGKKGVASSTHRNSEDYDKEEGNKTQLRKQQEEQEKDQVIAQLSAELQDMKLRYNALALQQQNSSRRGQRSTSGSRPASSAPSGRGHEKNADAPVSEPVNVPESDESGVQKRPESQPMPAAADDQTSDFNIADYDDATDSDDGNHDSLRHMVDEIPSESDTDSDDSDGGSPRVVLSRQGTAGSTSSSHTHEA